MCTGIMRLGIAEHESLIRSALCRSEPVNIIAAPRPTAAEGIYLYLRYLRGYNLSLNCHYRSTTDLITGLIEDKMAVRPDVLVASPAGAAMLLGSQAAEEFIPLMFMAARPHAVILPGDRPKIPANPYDGHFLICDHGHSGCAFYFESLIRSGMIHPERITVEHVGLEQGLQALREQRDDCRLSTSLDPWRLLQWFHPFTPLETSRIEMSGMESVIFVHSSFAAEQDRAKRLEIAIRDAWLDLEDDTGALDIVLDLILEDREFLKLIKRSAGLFGAATEYYRTKQKECSQCH